MNTLRSVQRRLQRLRAVLDKLRRLGVQHDLSGLISLVDKGLRDGHEGGALLSSLIHKYQVLVHGVLRRRSREWWRWGALARGSWRRHRVFHRSPGCVHPGFVVEVLATTFAPNPHAAVAT